MNFLRPYLLMEEKTAAVGDLENFLKERGFVEEKPGRGFKDLNRFYLELLLSFKQNRYREIVEAGKALEQSFLVIPDSMKEDYASILEIIGDSYQKLDYLYESNDFYLKALKVKGDDVRVLLKMRKNYERLNNSDEIRRVDESIQKALTPRELALAELVILKNETFSQPLILDGAKVGLSIELKEDLSEPLPIISVFLNGQVIWDDYAQRAIFSVEVNPEPGLNFLEITPQNKPVTLLKLTIGSHPSQPGQ